LNLAVPYRWGYTGLAERLQPVRVVPLLDEFFCAMLKSFSPVAARWRNEFAVITGIGIGVHSGERSHSFNCHNLNCADVPNYWISGACQRPRDSRTE
jgi:hypothetical protein